MGTSAGVGGWRHCRPEALCRWGPLSTSACHPLTTQALHEDPVGGVPLWTARWEPGSAAPGRDWAVWACASPTPGPLVLPMWGYGDPSGAESWSSVTTGPSSHRPGCLKRKRSSLNVAVEDTPWGRGAGCQQPAVSSGWWETHVESALTMGAWCPEWGRHNSLQQGEKQAASLWAGVSSQK